MSDVFLRTLPALGTVVTLQVVGVSSDADERAARADCVERAIGWFREVEAHCSRSDPTSEVSRLAQHVGEPVMVSAILFEAVRFALALAGDTSGAFDPTLGQRLELMGADHDARARPAARREPGTRNDPSWRDVVVDDDAGTITLVRPLLLDLGAVAKGLAIDLAVRELSLFDDFAIEAGGDRYLAGADPDGDPWTAGIRHPRLRDTVIETLEVTDLAMCTSCRGAHRSAHGTGRRIIDPRSGTTPSALASATVLSTSAMVADGLATAAFVLGPADGLALLQRHGVDGLLFTPDLERLTTTPLESRTQ